MGALLPPDGSLRKNVTLISPITREKRDIWKNGEFPFDIYKYLRNSKNIPKNRFVVVEYEYYQKILVRNPDHAQEKNLLIWTDKKDVILPSGCKACFSSAHATGITYGKDIFVIGSNSQIYESFIENTSHLILVWVDDENKNEGNNNIFTEIQIPSDFKASYLKNSSKKEKDQIPYRIIEYKRRPPLVR